VFWVRIYKHGIRVFARANGVEVPALSWEVATFVPLPHGGHRAELGRIAQASAPQRFLKRHIDEDAEVPGVGQLGAGTLHRSGARRWAALPGAER
jgi:hypothetical protein